MRRPEITADLTRRLEKYLMEDIECKACRGTGVKMKGGAA